jgi:hypothetical protein
MTHTIKHSRTALSLDDEVAKVQQQYHFDYLQARNHVLQRRQLAARPNPHPWGSAQTYMGGQPKEL